MRRFFGVIVFIFGVALAYGICIDAYKFVSSLFWNTANGNILSTGVIEEHCYKKCKINTPIAECEKQQLCYVPQVLYEFSVPEFGVVKSTTLLQYNYTYKHQRKDAAESEIGSFMAGNKVKVYYRVSSGKVDSFIKRRINIFFMLLASAFSMAFIFASLKLMQGKKVG